ncbi:MAG: hypothetical protein HYX63_01585 [Gammaproteobacteria bacterium]|nr:hypothetical protein [Gammaproteobacteria bacterium]
MAGNVTTPRYQSGAKTMENCHPVLQGGAKRAAGSRFSAETKTSSKKSRIIPFVFSTTQAYILEFGDLYLRFYKDKAQIGPAYEIVSPYTEADLFGIEWTQAADTMFIFHPSYYPRRLTRLADNLWKLVQAPFKVEPSEETGTLGTMTATLSALSGAITVTAASAIFQNADVGRQVASGLGIATITSFTSTTVVNATVVDAFSSVNLAANAWTITESPKTTCTPSAAGPEGAVITLTTAANAWNAADVGKYVKTNDGLVEITSLTSAVIANGTVRMILASTAAAASGGWRLQPKLWNDLNGYPSCGTLFEQHLITAGSPAFPQRMDATRIGLYLDFGSGTGGSDGFAYEMVSEQYNRILHLVSGRVLVPLTTSGEFSVTGSNISAVGPTNILVRNPSNYGCNGVRPVRVGHLGVFCQRAGRKLRTVVYSAQTEAYAAPDLTWFAEHVTTSGIVDMTYQQEPDSLIWAVRADGTIALCTLNVDIQGQYQAEYQQSSIGWARRITDGLYESVATIPYQGADQTWVLVKRTVNGVTKRYVEVIDALNTDAAITGTTFSAITGATWAASVVTITKAGHGYSTGDTIRQRKTVPTGYNGDYVITNTGVNSYTYALAVNPGAVTTLGESGKATAAWGGLSHLEAKSVDVLGDGSVLPQVVVSGGAVTLSRAAYEVEIGLHYNSTLELLPIEDQRVGSVSGNVVSIHETIIRVNATIGLTIDGQYVAFRKFGVGVLDQPVAPFSGDKGVMSLGWAKSGGAVVITQTQPLPFHVLCAIRRYTVNDG